ncbi:MAG: VWA domain-containing protein [Gammaproteobacteria bacterium]
MADSMAGGFHLLEPAWLLALLPLALLLWRVSRSGAGDSPWRRIIDARLQPLLVGSGDATRPRLALWLLGAGWLVAVIALANPAWEREPQPLLQTSKSRVIVLDLSRSMLAQDLKPNRLERARFKVEDILAQDEEGQIGLVVFAGDAFTVTPLTRDADTIRAQLRALEPSLMPSQGSRADRGLDQALELLRQAGVEKGQVILIADGVEGDLAADAAERIAGAGHSVSVLGIGTPEGAPIRDRLGNMLRERSGKPVIASLDEQALRSVALAGGGRYRTLAAGSSDIRDLLATPTDKGASEDVNDLRTAKWKERGPWLTLMLLPLAALAFRRGWLLGLLLVPLLAVPQREALAIGWDDLWQRSDQQAAEALAREEYERAAEIATDPAQRGSAAYKRGDYAAALEEYSKLEGADADYNRGNALARLGRFEEAIAAYDAALAQQPEMEDATFNKSAVEELLKAREQQQAQNPQQQESGEEQQESQQQQSQDQQQSDQQAQGGDTSAQQQQESQGGEQQQQGTEEQDSSDAQQQEAQSPDGEQGDEQQNQFARASEALDEQQEQSGGEEQEQFVSGEEPAGEPEQRAQQQQMQEQQPSDADDQRAPVSAEELTSEEQMAAQQWLRRIPDDPGGLLRRKFLHQYQQRGRVQPRQGQGY